MASNARWLADDAWLFLLAAAAVTCSGGMPRRSLRTFCQPDEYQVSGFIFGCNGDSDPNPVQIDITTGTGQLVDLPRGLFDISMSITQGFVAVDIELLLYDVEKDKCIIGPPNLGCESNFMCGSPAEYCIGYEGMAIHNSRKTGKKDQLIKILGEATRPMRFDISGRGYSVGSASYSHSRVDPCPSPIPGCRVCSDNDACRPEQVPQCDGSVSLYCVTITSISSTTTVSATGTTTTSTSSHTSTKTSTRTSSSTSSSYSTSASMTSALSRTFSRGFTMTSSRSSTSSSSSSNDDIINSTTVSKPIGSDGTTNIDTRISTSSNATLTTGKGSNSSSRSIDSATSTISISTTTLTTCTASTIMTTSTETSATSTATNASEGGAIASPLLVALPTQGESTSAASGSLQLIAVGLSTGVCLCMLCLVPLCLYWRHRSEPDYSQAIVPDDDFSDLHSLPWGPLDLVCCIESSSDVGQKGLQRVNGILNNLVRQLEMPPVKVGVISFDSTACAMCQLSADREAILSSIAAIAVGDATANLLQPLQEAGLMLEIGGASSTGDSPSSHNVRSKVILVVCKASDGPKDLAKAAQADPVAADLKRAGATVMFLQVGERSSRVLPEKIASRPIMRHVFHLGEYNGPGPASGAVLGRLSDIASAGRQPIEPVYVPKQTAVVEVTDYRVQIPSQERPVALIQDAEQQTDPLIKVCLAPWQARFDLVICIDCHGSQVGSISAFDRAKVFAEQLASTVQMPEVRLALLCAGETDHREAVRALSDNLHDFNVRLRTATPTRSAQPSLGLVLREACSVFRKEPVGPGADPFGAVVVVTDGDLSDVDGAACSASELRERGIQLLFVKIGRIKPVGGSSPGEAVGSWHDVFECGGEPESFRSLVPDVLRKLLLVGQQIVQARCTLPAMPVAEVATDFDHIEGHEVQLPEGVVMVDPSSVPWEPGLLNVAERHYKHHCKDLGLCLHLRPWLELQNTACSTANIGTLHDTATSDDVSIPEKAVDSGNLGVQGVCRVSMSVQTDPIVKVSLLPWRQSHLDLVVCLLNSSPNSSAPQSRPGTGPDASIHLATLERQKGFIKCLARSFHMPEVRLRLVSGQVASEWCSTLEEFTASLRNINSPSVTEVPRLVPSLREALHLLGQNVGGTRESLNFGVQAKAVLIITDGGHVDNMQEVHEVATMAMARGVQLHVVRIARGNGANGTSTLASLATLLRSMSTQSSTNSNIDVADSVEELDALVPQLLQRLLRVTRRILRARCTLPLEPYEVVASEALALTEGHEVKLPQDEVLVDGQFVAWDPSLVAVLGPKEPVPGGADAGGGPELSELEELTFRVHCAVQEKNSAATQGDVSCRGLLLG